jgi:hypothetical protein
MGSAGQISRIRGQLGGVTAALANVMLNYELRERRATRAGKGAASGEFFSWRVVLFLVIWF